MRASVCWRTCSRPCSACSVLCRTRARRGMTSLAHFGSQDRGRRSSRFSGDWSRSSASYIRDPARCAAGPRRELGGRSGRRGLSSRGASPHEGVIARRLFPLQLVICASPEYLQQHGVPESLAELTSHRCSAFRNPGTGKVVPWHVKIGDQVRPAGGAGDLQQ